MTLFDSQPGTDEPGGPRRVTLVRLSALIAQAIATVGRVTVEGEIHRPQSGRTGRQWFTLRDRASQISVSVPTARRARCRIVAGERVAVTGRLEWVNDWGQLQLIAEEVVPVGEGAIAALIAETRERLRTDGLIDRPRRRIPMLPRAVGVVCGHEAAVRADIESVIAARFASYPVVFVTTTVSGPGAVDNLVASITELDGRADVDVIILARGGGDSTALLPFSDEAVCRAVAAARTPVVSAIGHDGDRPLVDEVADLRCGTPSIAAAAVIPDAAALWAEIDGLLATVAASAVGLVTAAAGRVGRIDRDASARAGLDRAATRLARAGATRELVHPARELDRATDRLERIAWRTPPSARMAQAERTLAAVMAQVETLSPVRVLERGYAVVRRADGSVVRDAAGVRAGEDISVSVATGSFAAAVIGNGMTPRTDVAEGAAR